MSIIDWFFACYVYAHNIILLLRLEITTQTSACTEKHSWSALMKEARNRKRVILNRSNSSQRFGADSLMHEASYNRVLNRSISSRGFLPISKLWYNRRCRLNTVTAKQVEDESHVRTAITTSPIDISREGLATFW